LDPDLRLTLPPGGPVLVQGGRPLRATYATRWSFISRAWLVLAGGLVPREQVKSGVGTDGLVTPAGRGEQVVPGG
jgi:hypothetical protein